MNKWTTRLLILILLCLAGLSAYNYFERPFISESIERVVETIQVSQEERVFRDLTNKEKLAQLLAVPLDLNFLEEEIKLKESPSISRETDPNAPLGKDEQVLKWIEKNNAGLIIYFGDQISVDASNLALEKIKAIYDRDEYPPLIVVDHEGGLVQRLSGDGFTKLESWKEMSSYSEREQKKIFRETATELSSAEIDIVFAPVLDLAENNSILLSRVASDSAVLYQSAENYIYALSREQIMPVVKHFPGIGSISKDLHYGAETIIVSKEDTAIFQKVLDKFPNIGVMTAHIRLKDKLGGKICTLSNDCLKDLIEHYPDSLLFTDDLMMKSARTQLGTNEEMEISAIAIEAIRAGNDVLVFGRGVEPIVLDQVLYALEMEYNDSESFRQAVDESLFKILKLKN